MGGSLFLDCFCRNDFLPVRFLAAVSSTHPPAAFVATADGDANASATEDQEASRASDANTDTLRFIPDVQRFFTIKRSKHAGSALSWLQTIAMARFKLSGSLATRRNSYNMVVVSPPCNDSSMKPAAILCDAVGRR